MRKARIVLIILAILCLIFFQPSGKDSAQPRVNPMAVQSYAMMKDVLELSSGPEMAMAQAKFYKNLYEALIQTGFTKEQAIQIVIHQGNIIPLSGK